MSKSVDGLVDIVHDDIQVTINDDFLNTLCGEA